MNLSKIAGHGLSITALVMGFLFLVAACEAEPTPTAAPTPTPTVAPTHTPTVAPTPTPTVTPSPTPEPELPLDDLLSRAGEKLAEISTAKFQMIDELESGSKFFGMTLKSVEGEVKSPDSFRMLVAVETSNFGFVEIEMLAVGDRAFMKFSKDAPWARLPLEQVPFNFGGLGITLSELLPAMKNTIIAGRESVGGVQTISIGGDVVSEEMANLITSTDPGHAITLTFWVDEVDYTLRQFRIAGKLFDDDGPETKRLISIMNINVPVDIQLPEIDSES